jgi:precorrin-8X/cobalt-precorrin-8 methylmutase
MTAVHPIEAESYRILAERIDLSHLSPTPRAVVERVIHASADLEYASTMSVPLAAVFAGVEAIRAGAPVVTDVEMTRVGITGVTAECFLDQAMGTGELTRSAAAMRLAAKRHPTGAVFVIGCAPTALNELVSLAANNDTQGFAPALVIGLPVGFVGAADAKEAARQSGLRVISNRGEKGGSAVAAAACNAIVRLAAAGASHE